MMRKMDNREVYALFWDHVEELRRTFIRVLLVIAFGVALSFYFYEYTLSFLTLPLVPQSVPSLQEERLEQFRIANTSQILQTYILPHDANLAAELPQEIERINAATYLIPPGSSLLFAKPIPSSPSLTVLGPLEGMFAALKASVWIGAAATSPIWIFILFQFIFPALRQEEKRLIWPFIISSFACMAAGCTFALTVAIPFANAYLKAFNEAIGANIWTLTNYLDYTLFLILANSLAFELCAIGIFAVRLGMVTAEGLAAKRRLAIVIAFIIGALLTPPDVVTQIMLAIPLIVLYEAVIIYARLRKKNVDSSAMNRMKN